jgi:hypothetical protein
MQLVQVFLPGLSVFLLQAAAATAPAPAGDEGFVALFDGKSLSGWKMVDGDAVFRVADTCIVAEVGSGKGAFLRTEKSDYRDFILKLEVRLDTPCNSGIQFRSYQRGGNGTMCGYQCEVDPSPRAWSGGIYYEGGRGWIYPLKNHEAARKAFKVDGWNQFTIQAVGPRIQTWLNGVPCADLTDTADRQGFFALQMHPGKQGKLIWRNIRVKQLDAGK